MARVRLVSSTDDLHAEGEVDDAKIAMASGVTRNSRVYHYAGMKNGLLVFRETTQPYLITEF